MKDCKHKIPIGAAIVTTISAPAYDCGFCEMERLQRVEAAAKAIVDFPLDGLTYISTIRLLLSDLKRAIENNTVPRAAVSYIVRSDNKILVVWNKRYSGWSLPGGKVEDGEDPGYAQLRELLEETSLTTLNRKLVYEADTAVAASEGRGRWVLVFKVEAQGTPRETEPGCPVTWMTREELLKSSPFKTFYEKMFDKLDIDIQ